MKPFGLLCVVFTVLAGHCLLGKDAQAATLTVANVTAVPSAKNVRVAVDLAPAPEDAVSGVQFDLVYDASNVTLTDVQTGPAAAAAGKTASFHIVTPGKCTIIVSGLNKNSIATGCVAKVLFDLSDQPAGQVYSLVLERIIMTDAAGHAIPNEGVSGSITVTEGEPGCLGAVTNTPQSGGPPGLLLGDALIVAFMLMLCCCVRLKAIGCRHSVFLQPSAHSLQNPRVSEAPPR